MAINSIGRMVRSTGVESITFGFSPRKRGDVGVAFQKSRVGPNSPLEEEPLARQSVFIRDLGYQRADEDDSVSLVFFSDKEGYSLAQVDLTRPKFEAIRAAASNAGLSLEELLNRGIMRMLDTVNFSKAELESAQYDAPVGSPPAAKPAPTIGSAELELDLARLQSDALTALLADKLANLANSGTPFEGKLAASVCGGFVELARVTQERLQRALFAFSRAVESKLGEVAA